MPAHESNAGYYLRKLGERLPDSMGEPLATPLLNDFTINSDFSYFRDIEERVKAAYAIDPNVPTLPGLEPKPIDPEEMARKQHRAVAATRSERGAGAVMQVIVTTFNEDTSRSLYRFQKHGEMIPVAEEDTPGSLYNRVSDYVDDLFVAAALARVVPSAYTRQRGERDLRTGFELRKDEAVLPLATFTGRNNARLRNVWLRQLEVTTQGYRYLPAAAKKELLEYIESRPQEYVFKPDMHSVLASLHRKNTKRFRKSA